MIRKFRFSPDILILISPWVLLSPVIFTGKALFWGTVSLQFLPWRVYAWQMIRDGQLPLWNPLVGMGAPLLANYQSALLYPPNWLTWLAFEISGISGAAWSLAVIVAFHLMIAGFGMKQLAKHLGIHQLGQVVSGLAFGLCGYLVARSGFLSINAAVAWLPWIVLGIDRVLIESSWKKKIPAASLFVCFQLLSGHAQTSWYTLLLVSLWTGYRVIWNADIAKLRIFADGLTRCKELLIEFVYKYARVAFVFILAFGCSAIQLIPTFEYLGQSQRSNSVSYEFASTYSFWPWRFLTLLSPNIFGNPTHNDYWGYGNYWEDALYLGLLPLLLAFGMLIRHFIERIQPTHRIDGERSTGRVIGLLIFLMASAFVLALGKNTPVYEWFYEHIPTFDMFQAPTRITLWAVFSLALLAGYGADRWFQPTDRKLYWSRLAVAGSAAIGLASGIAWYLLGDVSPTFIRAAAHLSVLAIIAAFLNLIAPRQIDQTVSVENQVRISLWQWSVSLFIAADIVIAGWGLNPGIEAEFFNRINTENNPLINITNGGRIYISAEDEYDLKYKQFMRFDSFTPGSDWKSMGELLLPNLGVLAGIAAVNNYDPFVPASYAEWIERIEIGGRTPENNVLNVMSVGAVLEMGQNDELPAYKSVNGQSRYYFSTCAILASSIQDSIEIIKSDQYEALEALTIESNRGQRLNDCSDDQASSHLVIRNEFPNRVQLEVDITQDGWIVRSETWFPGWHGLIDNTPAEIIRANGIFQAIKLEKGKHIVEFIYEPSSFTIGALINLISGLVLGVVFWQTRRK